jgi:hypothetical protein
MEQLPERAGSPPTRIPCDSVVSGAIADTTGPPRGDLGPVRFSFPRTCTGPRNSTWQVEQRGIAGFGAFRYHPATREVEAKVTNVSLHLTGNIPDVGSCKVVATVHANATYSNPPDSRLRIAMGSANGSGGWVESSTCPTDIIGPGRAFSIGADYDLGREITITSPPASEVVGP